MIHVLQTGCLQLLAMTTQSSRIISVPPLASKATENCRGSVILLNRGHEFLISSCNSPCGRRMPSSGEISHSTRPHHIQRTLTSHLGFPQCPHHLSASRFSHLFFATKATTFSQTSSGVGC
jgi:hypothetical protein